jgi:hypothetical protein
MAQFRKDSHQYLPDGRTIFEVVMLADQYGNLVGPANPSGTAVDAFGRARVSQPLTLFDSSHRYKDNGLWFTSNTAGTTYAHNANAGLIELNLPTTADAEIVRETTKVFAYQPGKSLQNLNTFVFNPAKTNLRQRVGYFGAQNGVYLELDGSTLYFVERSYVGGNVSETRVAQSNWNVDTLLGAVSSSPSGITLDISKAQISFFDVEWLGLGTVRCGFVINGQLIHCHSFHHANLITSTYMTTACLPVRYEIKNNGGATATASTMKQVCSTVISEGGYELFGAQQSIGTTIGVPKALATAGTYYPVVSIRLKSTALDAIIILTALSMMGVGNGVNFAWRVTAGATVTTASWTTAGADSAVEYTLIGTAVTGGRILASGFINSSNQGSPTIDILKEALFKFQLERNGLTSTPVALTLEVAAGTANESVYASMDWEEVTR